MLENDDRLNGLIAGTFASAAVIPINRLEFTEPGCGAEFLIYAPEKQP
jgi:hypothetical protein